LKRIYFLIGITTIFLFFGCSEKYKKEAAVELSDKEKCLIMKNGEACHAEALKCINDNGDLSRISDSDCFIEWAEKGCDYKFVPACDSLFRYWHIKNDKEKAYKLGVKSCELNKSEVLYLDGLGNRFNRMESLRTCVMFANVYYFPEDSIYKDRDKAIEISVLACENEVAVGCLFAGLFYRKEGKDTESEAWLQRGCIDAQEALSCVVLIEKYDELKNKEKVEFYFNKLDEGSPHSVTGFIYMAKVAWKIKKDVKKTTKWLETGLNKDGISVEQIEKESEFKDLFETQEYAEMIEKFKTIEKREDVSEQKR